MRHGLRGTVMLAISASSRPVTTPCSKPWGAAESATIQDTSEEVLLSAIAAGDKGALQTLYLRHKVRVYRYVLRLIGDATAAEDIASEVFLEVWRQADAFEAKSRVSTWILGVARYKALSTLRSRSKERFDERAADTIADDAEDPEAMAERQEQGMIVRKCLSQLSAIHREVIDLVYYHEKSIKEVAQIVGVPESTVKTRMFYARKRMETMLETAGVNRH
jgi:RNA polymerase sigma-70 factor, ECF subfamily